MRHLAVAVLIALAAGLGAARPALADAVSDAQSKVDQAEQEQSRLRAEYSVLAEQARGAEGSRDRAQLRVVNLQRSIDDADGSLGEARKNLTTRARRAYMGDPLGNVDAVLRLTDYAQIDAYLPYVTRPLEDDRRAVAVYHERLGALQALRADLDAAKDDALRQAGNLSAIEAHLTANLNVQEEKLAGARRDLAAAQASAAAQVAAADQPSSATADPPRGPQPGSGPGPGSGVPDPVDVPPAPRSLPNGVELGPAAGVPKGMRASGVAFSGVASWYGPGFHGHTTADGEVYDQYGFTAASRTLPFNTVLLVSFHERSVLLRVNDRGPYVDGRVLDLSKGAADALGLGGLGYVDAQVLVPA